MVEKQNIPEKRSFIHKTERRRQTFLPPESKEFLSRKEKKQNKLRRRRVFTYLSLIPMTILTILAVIIINLIPKPTPEVEYTIETGLETDGEQFTGLTNTINFGEPSPPGITIQSLQPLIIDFTNDIGKTIPVELKYVNIRETNTQETYLLNNVIKDIEGKTIWLAKITATFDSSYAEQKPDITSVLIPESTSNNIVNEIRITGWQECETKTRTVKINNIEMHQQEHCMVLITDPEKTIRGIKYVGHYGEKNNPYSVVDGKPVTMLTPKNVIQ